MKRIKGWSWAAVGAVGVLVALWAGVTAWTAIKQRNDETRITRIERIVNRHSRGGDALHPASNAGQQPGPSKGGPGVTQGESPKGAPKPRHPQPSPAPPSAPSTPPPSSESPSAPPAQPGNSGSGASAEHGVSACVEIAISACVKTELP